MYITAVGNIAIKNSDRNLKTRDYNFPEYMRSMNMWFG